MTNSDEQIQLFSIELLSGITEIIEKSKTKAAVFLNSETTVLYWSIGKFINENLKTQNRTSYGNKIVATLSQQLSWSHLIEIATIDSEVKRDFYVYKCVENGWGIRELRKEIDKLLFERSPIAKLTDYEIKKRIGNTEKSTILNPDLVFKNTYILDFLNLPQTCSENDLENQLVSKIEDFILELGNGFAFLERQKRISIDGEDYHLDLLFYHRKLKRLVAIDLKIGKFKPAYKGQMELYLRRLEKYEMQEGEERPIGLLLCSEGNTEHIELLMLNESEIKVAQYITEFPDKQWFADKLHKAIELTKHQKNN
jgi:predicted nuclease of restriction endonuclease-like (RecB) superfamily